MASYHFDYEAPQKDGRVRRPEPPAPQELRVKGIVFGDDSGHRSYHYDLRTRHPIAARVKRLLDLLFATFAITALAPLYLIIAALVKLSSPGPVIFRQRRIGFRCNQFDMYKFRTMYVGAHKQETDLAAKTGKAFLKLKNDPRVTPIGRFLRKYSLDELPQLFNVLQGTMSVVGPRPLLNSDLDKLPRRSGMARFSMPPGITGLWQVSGRSSCSELKRLRLDRHYVEHWSLALDFQILLRTVEVVFTGQDAV